MRAALVVIVAAACGDGIGAPDATLATDSPRGLVRVRIIGTEGAASQVIFQNSDSSLVLATRTNLEGTANAFMAPGGFVTVVVSNGFRPRDVYTWFDVQPGDELVLGEQLGFPGPLSPSFRLTVPDDPGQEFYDVSTTCGTSSLDAPFVATTQVFMSGCAEQHDVLIMNRDVSFQNEHYLFLDGVTLAGAVLEPEGPFRPLDIARVEVRGVPSNLFGMNVSMILFDGTFANPNSLRGNSFSISEGSGAIDLPMMLPAGATVMMSLQPSVGPLVVGSPRVVQWGPPQAFTSIDLAAVALRPYIEPPTYLRGTHGLRWSEWSAGVQADAVLASWGWQDFTRNDNVQWHLLAPRTEDTILRLPVLPYPELMPGPSAQLQHPYVFTNIKADGGYAKLRTSLPITWTAGQTWPIDAPSGTVVIQQLGSNQF